MSGNKNRGIRRSLFAIVFLLAITCLLFFKIFQRGFYPVPGDLLVSFYFPWYSGGWNGYNPWTTHKEMLGADSIRQIFPWKAFAFEEFKAGRAPLWNPYTASGQPLLANFQSSVFYPFNFFYFLTTPQNAWVFLVIIQPLFGGLFMYLVLRSFKLSMISSLFGSSAFMFSSYLITWMENGNISNSYIWLPLSVWAINNYFEKFRPLFVIVLAVSLALSVLAGHPQTAIYIYLITAIYFFYKVLESRKAFKEFLVYIFAALFSFTLSAVQFLPTYALYKNSPISLPFAKDVFDRAILPYRSFVTFFASDFFGHPANNNFWSQTYGDFTPYFGVIPLIFAIWAIMRLWKNTFVKFATLSSSFFIMAAVRGPITYLIRTLRIPILDSTTPSRFVSISIFLMIILAGFGFEDFLKNFKNRGYRGVFLKFLIPIGFVYLALWLFSIFGIYFLSPKEIWTVNLAVTRRNLILPTLMFLSLPLGLLAFKLIGILRLRIAQGLLQFFFVVMIFTVLIVGGVYYSNKFLPFAPKKFIFPDHPIFSWLRDNAGINRFYGGGTAHIDFNFPTYYKVYGVEGYDTLRLKRYAELLASGASGKVPESYLRSDAVVPSEENGYRRRLFELLGVKYLLDKDDDPKTGHDWHPSMFNKDNVKGIWQSGKFQVYERSPVLPRVFQTTKYYVAKSDKEIIDKIYDPNYNLESLILEKEPELKVDSNSEGIYIPKILKYESDNVVFSSELDHNSLLFLSDSWDPDWRAYIDDKPVPILRADYALRGVSVPAGSHTVTFKYNPMSFMLGSLISLISFLGLLGTLGFLVLKRKL